MADQPTHTQQGQIERAQRLREKIERMKHGLPEPDGGPENSKSLKEQIEERASKPGPSRD